MSLEQAAYLSHVVADLAVLAALLFIGSRSVKTLDREKVVAVNSLTAAIAAINVPAMESPELGEALSAVFHNWDCATREQRIIAHFFLFS